MPRISVCCSVLNQSEWLKEMIASVHLQTEKDWELIIVDDGCRWRFRKGWISPHAKPIATLACG